MSAGGRARSVSLRLGAGDRDRFLAGLATAAMAVALLHLAGAGNDARLAWADPTTAEVAARLLRLSGVEVARSGSVVSHPDGFGVYIYYLCTGWPLAGVMLIGLAALPGRLAGKALAAVAGTAALLVLNQLRLVSLFWVGLWLPDFYRFAHRWIWEPAMLVAVGAIWALWARYRPRTGAPP